MRQTRHLCLCIRGALNWPKGKLKNMFENSETGKRLTANEAREYLMDCLSEGKELLPLGKCEGFDYKTGCPGHPINDEVK
jgi:hypothetical protein